MPVFEYVGIDSKGKRAQGTVDGDNERAVRQKLRRMGVFPTSLGLEGIWYAIVASNVLMAIVYVIVFRGGRWKLKELF